MKAFISALFLVLLGLNSVVFAEGVQEIVAVKQALVDFSDEPAPEPEPEPEPDKSLINAFLSRYWRIYK